MPNNKNNEHKQYSKYGAKWGRGSTIYSIIIMFRRIQIMFVIIQK